MKVIHGNITLVLEMLKTAYTEEENVSQTGWVYFLSQTLIPGTTGFNLVPTPLGKTGILKNVQVTCLDNALFMQLELRKASTPAVNFLATYFVTQGNWDLNDIIISAGDNLQLVLTNNAAGNVTFTVYIFIVDAVGILT